MLSGLFAKESCIGIDIGARWIKTAEVAPTSRGWEVVAAGAVPTPPGSIKDGTVVNVADMAAQIRSAVRENGSSASSAVVAISGSQVIVRNVQFPKMVESVLRRSIKYEASRYISASMENSVVDFEILGEADDPAQMNVMLVAAPSELVDTRVRAVEAAGLEPLVVDIESFALIRCLVDFSATDEYLHKTVAIVDMGASHTDVIIVRSGEFALTRNIPIAGDSFTNSIKASSAGSFEDAEMAKLEMARQRPINAPDFAQSDNRSWRVIQPLMDEMIREIRRSINYYQSQFPESSAETMVTKVILTGGSARMPGMDSYVSSLLGIPATVADIFMDTALTPDGLPRSFVEEFGPVLGVAAGLALRETAEPQKKASLGRKR